MESCFSLEGMPKMRLGSTPDVGSDSDDVSFNQFANLFKVILGIFLILGSFVYQVTYCGDNAMFESAFEWYRLRLFDIESMERRLAS